MSVRCLLITDDILRSKSTPCSIHRNHNHPRTTSKEDRIARATPKALAHVRSAFASAAYFASHIAAKQAPLPWATISRCSERCRGGLATKRMGCLPGRALVGVDWKADEEGERWFLTELETTWKQRVADVIGLGKEAVHARDFIKMETSSACTVTFEAQETTPLMATALEKHGSLSLSRCLQHPGPGVETEALMNLLSLCFKPFGRGSSSNSDSKFESFVGVSKERKDGLLSYRDVGRYGSGEFSMAVVQANQLNWMIESYLFSEYKTVKKINWDLKDGIFHVNVKDWEVSTGWLCVYAAISAETHGVVTSETIQRAFCATEEGFTNLVSELWSTRPQMATVGSCCLVGVICQQTLFVANLGDSRVVLGKKVGNTGGVAAIQLSTEHNANLEVSRSIGDAYMKHARFNREPISAKFRLPEPMDMPILSANPTIISHPLHPNDSFLVFASDGLWEHLSNEKVVDIVHNNPRAGSAKRLVKAALQEAARKREMRYSDLQKIEKKVRRHFHDDITVIVLFLNHDLISKSAVQTPPVSIRSALER
ncbi:PROTEIN PHOSPHATASE 2C 42-RELATED [Salix purpurea]|uniref:PROTEIN PHOSPHATASE 2C 42-RELATED n=1 Tax=Salix purpurea TaxID=77065 RepID=A0A9Q0Z9R5_SALPP|nr:PROTEIN PHOSPHATASE 2C 42-RELATED [Salix purpurea]